LLPAEKHTHEGGEGSIIPYEREKNVVSQIKGGCREKRRGGRKGKLAVLDVNNCKKRCDSGRFSGKKSEFLGLRGEETGSPRQKRGGPGAASGFGKKRKILLGITVTIGRKGGFRSGRW